MMRKLHPLEQQGIEYLPIVNLPFDQQLSLRQWISETDILLIKDPSGSEMECVHYDVYDFWFDTFMEENESVDMTLF